MARTIAQRFWQKVELNGPVPGHAPHLGPCWTWKGARWNGYGALGSKCRAGKSASHRVSWEMHNSEIPDGLWVLHKCDNRLCVRPDHLFLGTIQDNNADRVRKGRGSRGEQINTCKLNEAQVAEVLRLNRAGVIQTEIARMFSIGQSTVSSIVRGQSWRHLNLVGA